MIENELNYPLCGGSNNCKVSTSEPSSCWCMEEIFSKTVLQLVPEERKGQCICKNCVDTYKANEKL